MPKSLHDYVQEALQSVKEIAVEDLPDYSEYVLLDVREPDEYSDGHIPGAINIPRGFLEVRADLEHYKRDERMQDRSQKFVCYCGGGHRSAMAAKVLLEMGFEEALSLAGGWTRYVETGGKVES